MNNNPIQQKINLLQQELQAKRGSGRTNRLILHVLEKAIHEGKSGDYFVILAHTPDWAENMRRRATEFMYNSKLFINQKHDSIEVKQGVLVLFKTEDWWDRNKMMLRDAQVFYDNVFSDMNTEKYINFLKSELSTVEF